MTLSVAVVLTLLPDLKAACLQVIVTRVQQLYIFSQETEQFNALHHVHRQIIELEHKQTRLSKTVNELVDEYNRHETTFSDIMNSIEKLDEQKVDRVLLSTQVNSKANKDELRDKVCIL